jgi:hypothetical protein
MRAPVRGPVPAGMLQERDTEVLWLRRLMIARIPGR